MNDMVICIGRQYGSGGREIGEKLAARLRIPCYDKLLVKIAAQNSGLSVEMLQREEEKPINSHRFLTGNPFVDSAALSNAFYSESQMAYEAEKQVIEQLGTRGSCVIIGRCASSLLRDKNILSVFIYADGPDRLERVMRRNDLDEKSADQRIRRVDRMRKKYFDFYSDTSWGQPESYDLMISSSKYGVDGCVKLILSAVESVSEVSTDE